MERGSHYAAKRDSTSTKTTDRTPLRGEPANKYVDQHSVTPLPKKRTGDRTYISPMGPIGLIGQLQTWSTPRTCVSFRYVERINIQSRRDTNVRVARRQRESRQCGDLR